MDMTNRSNNFDALRLIGALAVFVTHLYGLAALPQPFLVAGRQLGELGVMLFFTISGYLVSRSWSSDPDVGRFLARRALRLLPALGPCLFLTAELAIISGNVPGVEPYLADNALTRVPVAWGNGSLWTIPIEALCYGLFVVGAVVTRRMPLIWIAGAVLLVLIPPDNFTLAQTGRLGLFFAIGAAAAAWPWVVRGAPWMALAGLALLPLHDYLGFTLMAPLALWIGLLSWPGLRDAGRLGDFSYGIYIYGYPVERVFASLMPGVPIAGLFALSLTVTVALAALSWYLVERPALARKPTARRAAVVVEAT
jgi:peptidoglycan/LPS O-acetylase OafA/YrhL